VSLEAHLAQGNTLFLSGELSRGLENLEAAFALYDPQEHSAQALIYGLEPGTSCLVRIGWIFAPTPSSLNRWKGDQPT